MAVDAEPAIGSVVRWFRGPEPQHGILRGWTLAFDEDGAWQRCGVVLPLGAVVGYEVYLRPERFRVVGVVD